MKERIDQAIAYLSMAQGILDEIAKELPEVRDFVEEFLPPYGKTLDELTEDWCRGLEPRILDRTPIRYHCSCSRERMEKALISLGEKDLRSLIDDGQGAELSCHFCHSRHFFTTEQLTALLKEGKRHEPDADH